MFKKILKRHNLIKTFFFINNSKYHYVSVTKPNALLPKFLSNHDRYRCLKFFYNFQTDEILKQHDLHCKGHNQTNMLIPVKFKTVLNSETKKIKEVV